MLFHGRKWSDRRREARVRAGLMVATAFLFGTTCCAIGQENKPGRELDGRWKLVSVERAEETEPVRQNVVWIVKNNEVFYGGESMGMLTYDSASVPKVVDLSLHDTKKSYEGVYALEKDLLKICLNVNADGTKERPIDLSVKDQGNLRLLRFERVADPASEPATGYVGIRLDLEAEVRDVTIVSVVEGSPAEKAGLRVGDRLLSLDTVDVDDGQTLIGTIRSAKPGDAMEFRVRRDGVEKRITVQVAPFPFSLLNLFE
jgi:uncharacterized protein (TIGR03067 family)